MRPPHLEGSRMTGIEFIVRDRSGWAPPIKYRENNHPEFAPPTPPGPGEPLAPEHVQYIKDMEGFISVQAMAKQMGVSHGTVHNIRTGKRTGHAAVSRGAHSS